MSATSALRNSLLRLGCVVLAAFLASWDSHPAADARPHFGCAVLNNAVYFSAFDGTSGFELWKSDQWRQ